jgi:hypothetical protein
MSRDIDKAAAWRKAHFAKPEIRAQRKAWRDEYRRKNKDILNEKSRVWKEKTNYKEHVKAYHVKAKLANPERYLWKQAKKRAKDKNLEFTLILEDIKIPEVCPIMGVKLEYVPYQYSDYSPSIDRIDSSKGYTIDNIQIISSIANRMKWASTREQLLQFAKGILSLEKED